jgi:ADP-ribose pyrophosphatase
MSQPSSTDAVTLPRGVTAEMVADRRAADAASTLAAVRGVLGAFDWERDDRQYALEGIERIVGRTYTHPDVLAFGVAQGWAEAETDPARIDWPARQARAAIPFEVIDGRPVNPFEKTAVRYGRNEMGFWGEQLMADALVTVTYDGVRHLLMVERDDGYGWAVPGGHVEAGETGLDAAVRELGEETGLDARGWPFTVFREVPPRYVPDPRSSDEAWAVTIPVHIDLGEREDLPTVAGGDDARRAEWVPACVYDCLAATLDLRFGGQVFAAHVAMLREFLGEVTR